MIYTTMPSAQQANKARSSPRSLEPLSQVLGRGANVQRKADCSCGDACHCKTALLESQLIQPKLKIGAPGDRFEREADRIAHRVMTMRTPLTGSGPAVTRGVRGSVTGSHRQVEHEDEDRLIRTKTITPLSEAMHPSTSALELTEIGVGRPLGTALSSFFEPRFGHDFSHVRVHTSPVAARYTRQLNDETSVPLLPMQATLKIGSVDDALNTKPIVSPNRSCANRIARFHSVQGRGGSAATTAACTNDSFRRRLQEHSARPAQRRRSCTRSCARRGSRSTLPSARASSCASVTTSAGCACT